jgi:hypothetical protein
LVLTCLSEEGKVILPHSSGGRTTEIAASRHRRQTHAQATTSRRGGHRSAPASTRPIISVSSSVSRRDHRSSSGPSPPAAAGSTSGVTFASPPPTPVPREDRDADDSQDALRRNDTMADGRAGGDPSPLKLPETSRREMCARAEEGITGIEQREEGAERDYASESSNERFNEGK